jgi:alcohol dehydrogenase
MCGSDHGFYSGSISTGYYNYIPGHETVGTVERIGPAASKLWGVQEGDLVAVDNHLSCRRCDRCLAGDFYYCQEYNSPPKNYGTIPITQSPGLLGGYASYHYLAPASVLHPVPAGVSALDATLFSPLGAGLAWGVHAPSTRQGEKVAILGPGIRGLAILAAVKDVGAGFTMVTGHGERDQPRLELARQFGADLIVDSRAESPIEAFQEATGGLADVVIEVTHGAPGSAIVDQALGLGGPKARVVLCGSGHRKEASPAGQQLVAERSLQVIHQHGVSTQARVQALSLLESAYFEPSRLPRGTAGFAGMERLLQTMGGFTNDPPPGHAVFVPDEP